MFFPFGNSLHNTQNVLFSFSSKWSHLYLSFHDSWNFHVFLIGAAGGVLGVVLIFRSWFFPDESFPPPPCSLCSPFFILLFWHVYLEPVHRWWTLPDYPEASWIQSKSPGLLYRSPLTTFIFRRKCLEYLPMHFCGRTARILLLATLRVEKVKLAIYFFLCDMWLVKKVSVIHDLINRKIQFDAWLVPHFATLPRGSSQYETDIIRNRPT